MGNLAAARAHDFNETANDGSISAGRTKVSDDDVTTIGLG